MKEVSISNQCSTYHHKLFTKQAGQVSLTADVTGLANQSPTDRGMDCIRHTHTHTHTHRTVEEGGLVILDDSFDTEMWQLGSKVTVILSLDMWHPDLSEEQTRRLGPI